MLQSTMSESGLAFLAEAALVIFITVFAAMILHVWRQNAEITERHAALPLEDDGGIES